MRASAEQDQAIRGGIESKRNGDITLFRADRIVLDASGEMNSCAINSQRVPSFDVTGFRHAEQSQLLKKRRDNSPEPGESPFRTRGQAGVNERDWNVSRTRLRDQV